MSKSNLDKDQLISVLREEWTAIDELLSSLSEQDWSAPGGLPGWRVQDVVAHLIGTESMLAGQEVPAADIDDLLALPHVHNEIAAINERWARAIRVLPPAEVLTRFREITAVRLKALEAMSAEDFQAPSWTPVGQDTYARFMRIRLFDCWMHEQDIRYALQRPGHGGGPCVVSVLDEITASMGYIVGKRGKAPDGSVVTIELTGAAARTVHVQVDGKARVVAEPPGPATTTIRLDAVLFTRLAGGRTTAEEHRDEITVDGDQELGRRVAANFAYTI
jgi:uncharacterized protein (TIGR03083 family)